MGTYHQIQLQVICPITICLKANIDEKVEYMAMSAAEVGH